MLRKVLVRASDASIIKTTDRKVDVQKVLKKEKFTDGTAMQTHYYNDSRNLCASKENDEYWKHLYRNKCTVKSMSDKRPTLTLPSATNVTLMSSINQ